MSCEFCEPYHQKLIDGENGFCAITKNGELIVYPKAEGVNSVKIKIKRCPMCGRDFSKEEKKHHALAKIICPRFSKMDLQRWLKAKKIELRTIND